MERMTVEELKIFLFASLISADNDEYPEEIKQSVIQRYKEREGDWEYIFEPLGEDAEKYIKLMRAE